MEVGSLPSQGFRDRNQVIRLGGRDLYSWNRLTSLNSIFFFALVLVF